MQSKRKSNNVYKYNKAHVIDGVTKNVSHTRHFLTSSNVTAKFGKFKFQM